MAPSQVCTECATKVLKCDEVIECSGGCDKKRCLTCSKLSRDEYKLLNGNINIRFFCNGCSLSNACTKMVEIKQLIKENKQSGIRKSEIKEIVEDVIQTKLNNLKNEMKNEISTEINMFLLNTIEDVLKPVKEDILKELKPVKDDIISEVKAVQVKMNERQIINNAENGRKPESYADKVKNDANKNKIVIKPKEREKGNKKSKEMLKKMIEPTEGLVNAVREINNGGLILECVDENAYEQVHKKMSENLGKDYDLEKKRISGPRKKMLKVVGLTEKISEERFEECIKKQNKICADKEIRLIKIYENMSTRKESYNALIETDDETCNMILEQKRIMMEWDSCIVYEHETVRRCYKCLGFNHNASECINKKACGKCAGNHNMKDCEAKEIKCVNCSELINKKVMEGDCNHYAFSRACPVFQKIINRKRK